jgi:hypothetical protein
MQNDTKATIKKVPKRYCNWHCCQRPVDSNGLCIQHMQIEALHSTLKKPLKHANHKDR